MDSSLLSNIQKLFYERIEVFATVEFYKLSIVTGIIKIVLKVWPRLMYIYVHIGCAMLRCLVCLILLASFFLLSSLIKTCTKIRVYIHVHACTWVCCVALPCLFV